MPNYLIGSLFHERYKLNPVAVAGYPMYRGIARLLGMEVFSQPKAPGDIIKEIMTLAMAMAHAGKLAKFGA